jgi:maleate cis-trans isomerase
MAYRDISISAKNKGAGLNVFGVNLPGHDYGTQEELAPIDQVAEELAKEISGIKGEVILYGHCVAADCF